MELLNKIQQALKVPKGHKNTFGNYNYRNCEDILEAVKPLLSEGTLVLYDEIVLIGDRYYVKATAQLKSGKDTAEVAAYARESDDKKGMDAAQITGAASSYARKYALNGLFLIDDTKDADSDEGKDAPTPPKATKTPPAAPQATQKRANPPVYKSPGIKEQEAKKRVASLILNLTDEQPPEGKDEAAQWYGDKVFEFTGMSLNLATVEDLETIGDELGKLFDAKQ